jgi:uroporphyrinogen decarboxylase
MISRERVRVALSHEEPDRVPMMMSANPWVVENLKRQLGVQTGRDLLKTLGIDVFDMRGIDYKGAVGPRFVGPSELGIPGDWCGDVLLLFGYHEVVTETPFGKAYASGNPSLAACNSVDDLRAFPWPEADWFDYSTLRRDLEPWAEEFAIAATGASVFQHATLYRGFERLLLEMATDPELASFIIDQVSGFYYDYFRRIFEEAGDLIDIFRLADDIGGQQNLLISPRMLTGYLSPWIRKLADLAHQYGIRVMFHTDGNVRKVIPDLIDWGVDILDPVQPEVPSMNALELKKEFGDRLSFSGGVSAQEILPRGSTEDVVAEVKRVIKQLGSGGGYLLSPGHPSLQGDIPVENIIAMYQAGREFGGY